MSLIRKQGILLQKALNVVKYQRHSRAFCNGSTNFANISTDQTPFPGATAEFITQPKLTMPQDYEPIPIYRVMDREGKILDGVQEPKLERKTVLKMFKDMVLLNTMDKILYESQRQGRISFYMTNFGEEASHIGSAAALKSQDVVYGQYREAGVLVWRGFKIENFIDQCFGNIDDTGRGKQMPVHYGSKKLNFVTISSPLSTQMPQAAGYAYSLKRSGASKDTCVVCYFGEGAASEGDAHAAFNFAATLDCPVIMFCRNNGFAISTPSHEQYRGDGIAGRGPSYGIATIRCDGTDIFAVYNAMNVAREYVLKEQKPIIFEAMSYRVGHHSTSDDSTAYRAAEEIEVWNTSEHPITKLKKYMERKGWFDEQKEKEFVQGVRKQVLEQIVRAERKPKPHFEEMFEDVYAEMPKHLKQQMQQLKQHVDAHKQHYPLKSFQQK